MWLVEYLLMLLVATSPHLDKLFVIKLITNDINIIHIKEMREDLLVAPVNL